MKGSTAMKIVMTGGGTSGHVTPNIALFKPLKEAGFEISYIGTKEGIEHELVTKEGIDYYSIKAGKLRRYIDMQNVKDISRIFAGCGQALKILKNIKPDVVFSKGGFVSCPVVWAAKMLGIPSVIHESDITPGLANKLSAPFAKKICYAFPETKAHLPEGKSIYTGLPVRHELLCGSREKGLEFLGFDGNKPVLLLMGGSLGSKFLNDKLRSEIDDLLQRFDICHLCGKGNIDTEFFNRRGYCQFEYVNEELCDVMAASDFVITRGGATAIFEILALSKPSLVVPLSRKASRGDQIENAKSFKAQGLCEYIEEEELEAKDFSKLIDAIYENRAKIAENQNRKDTKKSTSAIVNVILSVIK